jgi:hypothetical protein
MRLELHGNNHALEMASHHFSRRNRCRYQLTYEGRHNTAANGNELYEGYFNRQRTVNEWVNYFADGLDQCMNGNLNANFDGGGKKGKKSLKKRRNRKTTHRKKNATKRR